MDSPPYADRFWTSADGLQLHARDYAGAPGPAALPVICLHGLTRNARDFEALAPHVAASGRRVLAADMRGRGGSDRDSMPANYNPGMYAQDVLGMMDALGIARAVFVGTSMGGIVTMVVGAARPVAVAGAVLNDIGGGLSREGLARIGAYVGTDPGVADWAGAAAYARLIAGHAHPAYEAQEWAAFARRIFAERDGRLALDYDPAIAELTRLPDDAPAPDLWPLFGALASMRPVLLLRGALSELLPAASVELMRTAAPAMAYAEVPGVGHAPDLSEPEAVAALDAFLKAVP